MRWRYCRGIGRNTRKTRLIDSWRSAMIRAPWSGFQFEKPTRTKCTWLKLRWLEYACPSEFNTIPLLCTGILTYDFVSIHHTVNSYDVFEFNSKLNHFKLRFYGILILNFDHRGNIPEIEFECDKIRANTKSSKHSSLDAASSLFQKAIQHNPENSEKNRDV